MNPIKKESKFVCSGRVGSSCYTSGILRLVTLIKHMGKSPEKKKNVNVTTTNGTYPCSSVTKIVQND